ncbi:8662_t:CDS:1, partial [Scutellospora calospora]
ALRFLAVAILGIITAYHTFNVRNKHVRFAMCINQLLVVFKFAAILILAVMTLSKTNNDPSYINNWHGIFNYTASNVSYQRTTPEFIGAYGSAILK